MSTPVTWNGSGFVVPAVGDANWGVQVSAYLIALPGGALQKTGGAFTLSSADVQFGSSYGLQAIYYKSNTANIAGSGVLRLATADAVAWRNAGNTADLSLALSGNVLQFNSISLADISSSQTLTNKTMDGGSNTFTNLPTTGLTGTVAPANGGTGVANNSASTITISGSFPITATLTASTAVTFPTTGTLATRAGSETLTNKTLTTPIIATISNTGTLTLPTSTDTLVGRATTDTLTNKTLGSTNTLTGATAASFTNTGTVTLPTATDTLVGRATTDTLTNKTFTAPVQSSYEDFTEIATPASPAAGKVRVYAKSGDNLFILNSSGTETQVGSGSGEKNYVQTGTSTATGWTASGAGITVANDTTAAELPRPNTTQTGIKVTGVSGSTAYAYYRFILDDADAGKKLKVQFDLKPVSGYASNDFKVDVYSNTASDYTTGNTRLPLSTDSSSVSGIPSLTGTFRTTFDAPAVTAKWIEVRIGLNGTNTHACVFSDVIVGPGVVVQGAAITEALSYTPTIAGVGTATNVNFWYRRVGSWYQIWGSFTTGTVTATNLSFTLPNGYTIDSTKVTSDNTVFGVGTSSNGVAQGAFNDGDAVLAFPDSGDYTKIYLTYKQSGTAPNVLVPVAANAFMGSSKQLTIGSLWVPVSELAGSGTVNLAFGDSNQSNPFSYTFTSWNPSSATGDVITNPSAGTVDVANSAISAAIASGTVTFTFNKAGYYNVTCNVGHSHANTYTTARFSVSIGGTAARYGDLKETGVTWANGIDAQDSDLYEAHTFLIYASVAGQTFTYLPAYESNGISTTAAHTAYASVLITPVSAASQAVGFATVSSTSAGLMPASNTALDDASATRLGLKQYIFGTTYNGVTPNVSGTAWSMIRGIAIPYQMNDGTWRLKLSFAGTLGATSNNVFTLAMAGVTFKNVASWNQAGCVTTEGNTSITNNTSTYASPNSSNILVVYAGGSTALAASYALAFDVELDSKPTWAY